MSDYDLPPFAPLIARLVGEADKAIETLNRRLHTVRHACSHELVFEAPWESGRIMALRICKDCRLEEEGSHWSGGAVWSRRDYEPARLGNRPGRYVVPITREQFYKLRVPHTKKPYS